MPSSGRWLIPFAWGFRRLWAASDFLGAQKVTKEPLGGGSGWALRAHIRRPLEPRYGGRITESFSKISGAQNLSGLCDSSRATSSSRISYPSLRPAGQSSLTPSLLLSNANPLRWALRWGPPSAACWTENFEWCGSTTAPGFAEPTRPVRFRRRGGTSGPPGNGPMGASGPTKDQTHLRIRRRGGCPHPPAVPGDALSTFPPKQRTSP